MVENRDVDNISRQISKSCYPIQLKLDRHGGYSLCANGDIRKDQFILVEKPFVTAFHPEVARVCRWCGELNPDTTIGTCKRCLSTIPGCYDIIAAEDELYKKTKNGYIYNILLTRLLQMEKYSKVTDEMELPVALDDEEVQELVKRTPTKLHSLNNDLADIQAAAQTHQCSPIDPLKMGLKFDDFLNLTNIETHSSKEGMKRLKFNKKAGKKSHIENIIRICCNSSFKLDVSEGIIDHPSYKPLKQEPDAQKAELVFLAGSFLNHSCDPNAQHRIIEGRLYVRALCDIPDGEEVTICYWPKESHCDAFVSFRQSISLSQYGFVCLCPKCRLCRKCYKEKSKSCSKCKLGYCGKCDKSIQWWRQHAPYCEQLSKTGCASVPRKIT